MTSSRIYLNFSRLFNHTFSTSPCDLHLNTENLGSLSEEICVELSSNMNYYILCPVCNGTHEIHYDLPNGIFSNIEDCYHTGKRLETK